MATNFQHGQFGSATANGTTICLTSWDVTHTSDLVDTTNTCDGGWHSHIPGLQMVDGSISGEWDLNADPYTHLYLVPNTKLTPLILNISPTIFYSMSAYISDFKCTVDVTDVIKWTASFKSTGPVTLPV